MPPGAPAEPEQQLEEQQGVHGGGAVPGPPAEVDFIAVPVAAQQPDPPVPVVLPGEVLALQAGFTQAEVTAAGDAQLLHLLGLSQGLQHGNGGQGGHGGGHAIGNGAGEN